jgi:alpha-L-fucosidase
MRRRDFFKLTAAAAAARALPLRAQVDTDPTDYEKFCATPAEQRRFRAFENGRFVNEGLDEKSWAPTAWGEPPALPFREVPGTEFPWNLLSPA